MRNNTDDAKTMFFYILQKSRILSVINPHKNNTHMFGAEELA